METFDNIIIGGGLSGIGAYSILNSGKKILLEKDNELLGHAKSHKFETQMFDEGAHICHSKNPNWLKLLNLNSTIKRDKSIVKNYSNGKWLGYPVQNSLSDLEFPDKEIAFQQITEALDMPNGEFRNYKDWCNKTYGTFLTSKYYEVFTKKYWRTDMKAMGTDWLNGRLLPINIDAVKSGFEGKFKNQAVFSSFIYPTTGGFSSLFNKIKSSVNKSECIFGAKIAYLDQINKTVILENNKKYEYKNLISTIPIPELIKLLKSECVELNELSSKLKYTSLFTLGIEISDEECEKLPDWFYIYDTDIDISRVFNNGKFSSEGSKKYLQCETFRRNDEERNIEKIEASMFKGCEIFLDRSINKNYYCMINTPN